jgi:hypothetical protein
VTESRGKGPMLESEWLNTTLATFCGCLGIGHSKFATFYGKNSDKTSNLGQLRQAQLLAVWMFVSRRLRAMPISVPWSQDIVNR